MYRRKKASLQAMPECPAMAAVTPLLDKKSKAVVSGISEPARASSHSDYIVQYIK